MESTCVRLMARSLCPCAAAQGIVCSSCPPRIEAALKAVDGVLDATVNMVTNVAKVSADSEPLNDARAS